MSRVRELERGCRREGVGKRAFWDLGYGLFLAGFNYLVIKGEQSRWSAGYIIIIGGL